jgi:flagellar motility protein MotE (MotC chaperone)
MKRPGLPAIRFLPLLLLVLLAILPVQMGSLWTAVVQLANAQETSPAPATPAPTPAMQMAAATAGEAEHAAPAAPATATTDQSVKAKAGTEPFDPLTLTRPELEVLQQLAKRRDELAARERELKDREQLLNATEQRLAAQVKQLQQLKAELEGMNEQQKNGADANVRRLVAIYEAMKPDEAARIFDTMDASVLLEVAGRMAERRLAPVLAQMTPARAQALTIAMANQSPLASAPAEPAAQP